MKSIWQANDAKVRIFSSNHLHLTAIAIRAASGGSKVEGQRKKYSRKRQRFHAISPSLPLCDSQVNELDELVRWSKRRARGTRRAMAAICGYFSGCTCHTNPLKNAASSPATAISF